MSCRGRGCSFFSTNCSALENTMQRAQWSGCKPRLCKTCAAWEGRKFPHSRQGAYLNHQATSWFRIRGVSIDWRTKCSPRDTWQHDFVTQYWVYWLKPLLHSYKKKLLDQASRFFLSQMTKLSSRLMNFTQTCTFSLCQAWEMSDCCVQIQFRHTLEITERLVWNSSGKNIHPSPVP